MRYRIKSGAMGNQATKCGSTCARAKVFKSSCYAVKSFTNMATVDMAMGSLTIMATVAMSMENLTDMAAVAMAIER